MRYLAAVALICCSLWCAPAHAQALISIDVRDVDVSDVIALLAAQSGRNVIADSSIKPERVTLHLQGVTFEEALQAILSAHGLQVHRENGILIVGAAAEMTRRYGGTDASASQTVVFVLQHAAAEDVAKELEAALPAGDVILSDKRTGSLVVTADAPSIARARHIVAAVDVPSGRNDTRLNAASYRLSYVKPDDVVTKLRTVLPQIEAVADAQQNAILVTGDEAMQAAARAVIGRLDRASPQVMFEVKVADVTPVNDQRNVGLQFGGLDLQGQPLAGGTTYAFTGGTIPVNVQLNALVSRGRASILATPKLVTLNNKEADLMIGQTYPIVYSTSVLGGQNVQYVDIGVRLRLTPTIGTDGSVTAELHPEYSELEGFTSSGYPIVTNRKIDSTLRVRDNETIVLGGLMRDASSETISKVPWLSEIPILGKFFQNKQSTHERDEIVFLITPHVIYPAPAK